ncbi:hypothetical protein C8R43DRAFT_1141602 [Mycena crocata]|nr:hypothetical protein C8R43DRAFT_1141602 [Mycena crocata]
MSTLSCDENLCRVREASLSQIPPEILGEIFVAAKDDGLQPVGTGILPVISSVSAEWRTVACQYPALWTSFSCDIYRSDGEVNLVETYLQRSKSAPLSVILDTGSDRRHHLIDARNLAHFTANPAPGRGPLLSMAQLNQRARDLGISARIIAFLAQHSEHVYKLQLTGRNWVSHNQITGFHGRLPLLEIVQLDSSVSTEFELAPRLHTVFLDGHRSGNIPMAQIRSLHLTQMFIPSPLTQFSQLTSLVCNVPHRVEEGHWMGAHIVFPHLSSWHIDFTTADNNLRTGNYHHVPAQLNFFDRYTMPALESLEVTSLTPQSNLLEFLQRSQSALKKLAFDKYSVRPAETLQILSSTPNLQSFTIRDGTLSTVMTERLLEALMGRGEQCALLLQLNHICIDGTYAFSDSLLAEIIESRNPICTSLQVEFFVRNRVVKEADLQRFRALEGVHFRCIVSTLAER